MNWLFVNGSPRKGGNTEYVFDSMRRARGLEGETSVFLADLDLGPCVDCRACKSGGLVCARRDAMAGLYPRLEAADRVVLGSPIYWSGVTGPMKNFLDRLRPYYGSGRLAGKELVTVTVGAGGAEESDLIDAMYRRIAGALKARVAERVVETAFDLGDLEKAGYRYAAREARSPGAGANAASTWRLVDIGLGDIELIKELWEANRRHHEEITPHFKSQYRGKSFEERMADLTDCVATDLKITVLEEGGRRVGYCLSRIDGGRGELETLHVEAGARGRGCGKALIEDHVAWMRERGCETIGVAVLADNAETVKVYRKLGFYPNTMYMELLGPD